MASLASKPDSKGLVVAEDRHRRRLAALRRAGLSVERYDGDRWAAWRKLGVVAVVGLAGALAMRALALLSGDDWPISRSVGLAVFGLGILGLVYLASLITPLRAGREGMQLVGVGFTPDGLLDALVNAALLPISARSGLTAVLVSPESVSLLIGRYKLDVASSPVCDVRVGQDGNAVWLLIGIDEEDFALRLRGPVGGTGLGGAASDTGRGNNSNAAERSPRAD